MPAVVDHNQIAQTDWDDALSVADCMRQLWRGRDYKRRIEQLAWRNEQFLFGNHWYAWDDNQKAMVPNPRHDGWQARIVYNKILDAVESRTAKLIRQKSVWSTLSGADNEGDRVVQRLTDKVMGWYWTEGVKMPRKVREALQWAMSSAVVFGHPFWNRNKGPRITIRLDEQLAEIQPGPEAAEQDQIIRNRFFQQFGPEAHNAGVYDDLAGDYDVDLAPLPEVIWWPFKPKSFDEARIWMRTQKKTSEEIGDMFDIEPEKVREMAAAPSGYGSGRSEGMWSDRYFYDDDETEIASSDGILLKTAYKVPSRKYPDGRQAVQIGNGELIFGPENLQNESKVVPLFPLIEKPIRGNAHGTCIVDQMISAQENLNRAASQIADYSLRRVMPTIVEFSGAGAQPNSLSNRPGKIYKCNSPELVPRTIQMPDIGRDYFNTMGVDLKFIQDISGNASIDQGRTDDANVKSGRAILSLQAQNNLKLIPTGERIDEWVEALGNFGLLEIQAKASWPRLIQIIGAGNELEAITFKGSDLRPSNWGDSTTNARLIRVKAHSIIPKTPEELFNFVKMSMEAGLLNPQTDRNEILEMLGESGYRKQFDKRRPDFARAESENRRWVKGEPVEPPDESDDHGAHLQVHDRWHKTEEYHQMKRDLRFFQVVQNEREHYENHKRAARQRIVEEPYLLRRADVSMWMKHRSQLLAQLAEGAGPEFATNIANLVFPLPLAAIGMLDPEASGDQKSSPPSKPQPAKKKSRSPNGTSPDQGVSKTEKTNAG